MSALLDPARLIMRLSRVPPALRAIVACFNDDDARWRPDDSSWSVLEIVCHMVDEEAEDFRTRVFLTLEQPSEPWPSIDPQGWVRDRRYQDQSLAAALDRFEHERASSIERLNGLTDPDWARVHVHPVFGSLSAGGMLASWAAHDALHLRQLVRRLHQLADRDSGGAPTGYAGTW